MIDIAALGLSVTSDGLVVATDRLKNFEKAAGGADREAEKFSGSMKKLASVAGTVLGSLAAAFSVRALINYADAWSDMQSKIGAAVKDMEAAPRLMRRMVDLANASYSPLAQTVDVFSRNVVVLKQLGLSADQAIDYTEALNHALVITATKGQDAETVIGSLSRALANGKLNAENFEVIMSSSPRVLEAMADELGVSVIELRRMATEGKVTSDVIRDALLNSLEQLREEAGNMPATVGDALVRISTGFQYLVGSLDQMMGASGTLATILISVGDALKWLGDNAEMVAGYLIASAAAMTAYFLPSIIAAIGSVYALVAAFITLRGIMITTGIGALVVLIGTAIGKFLELVKATGGFGEALSLLKSVAIEVWGAIIDSAQAIPLALTAIWYKVKAGFAALVAYLIEKWTEFLSLLNVTMGPLSLLVPGMRAVGSAVSSATEAANSKLGDLNTSMEQFTALADSGWAVASVVIERNAARAGDALGQLKTKADEANNAINDLGNDPTSPTSPTGGGGGGEMQKAMAERFKALTEGLESEIQETMRNYALDLEALRWALDQKKVTYAEYQEYMEQLRIQIWGAEWEQTLLQYQTDQEALQSALDMKLITYEDYYRKLKELQFANLMSEDNRSDMAQDLSNTAQYFGQLYSLTGNSFDALQRLQQSFQAASALMNAWKGYTDALATGGLTPWMKLMWAGKILAAGMGAVRAIKGGGKGGGGGGGGVSTPSGSDTSSVSSEAELGPKEVIVRGIRPGDIFTGQQLMDLTDSILGEQERRGVIIRYAE